MSSAAVLFADVAGYTALTEAHGDDLAADLVGTFDDRVGELLPAYGGERVKVIGDALMLRVADPSAAVGLALAIVHDVMRDHGCPAVRAGVHCGPAVERRGDWFGTTVNVAARVASLAVGGEVLVTAAVREAAGDLDGVTFVEPGRSATFVSRCCSSPPSGRGRMRRRGTPSIQCAGWRWIRPGRRGVFSSRGPSTSSAPWSAPAAGRFAAAPDQFARAS